MTCYKYGIPLVVRALTRPTERVPAEIEAEITQIIQDAVAAHADVESVTTTREAPIRRTAAPCPPPAP